MSHIILVDSDDSFRTVLTLNLMKSVGSRVTQNKSIAETIHHLKLDSNVDLIIYRKNGEAEQSDLVISDFLKEKSLTIRLLIIHSNMTWEEIVFKTVLALGVEANPDGIPQKLNFVPVGINYFFNFSDRSIGSDIYIRVKKGNEFHYIKRFHFDEKINNEDIQRYKISGLRNFYIEKEKFRDFVDFSTLQVSLTLKRINSNEGDRAKLNSDAFNLMTERVQMLGIDKYTVELVKSAVESMEDSLGSNNALVNYLNLLKSNSYSYGYSHSYLCCLLLHKISKQFDWCTAALKEKLTLVSYFHDISLTEELVDYNCAEDLKYGHLDEYDKVLVTNHAQVSANIVSAFDFIPEGVGSIIREHHGSKNGVGFQESLSSTISPVSMMFVVVENFVDEFLNFGYVPTTEEIESILEMLKAKYTKLTYEETIVALSKMVHSKKF